MLGFISDAFGFCSYMIEITKLNVQEFLKTKPIVDYPPSWDIWQQWASIIIRNGLLFRGNSIGRIQYVQKFVFLHVPGDITVERNIILDYSVDQIIKLESDSTQFRHSSLAEIPFESFSHNKSVSLEGEWIYKSDCENTNKIILYFHGGAYFCGSIHTHRLMAYHIARTTDAKVLMVNYRLAPEHPFPCALHDVFAWYLYLIDPLNPIFNDRLTNSSRHSAIHPKNIILMGDSAGGGLALSLITYLRDYLKTSQTPRFSIPLGLALFSPWIDLTCSSESWRSKSKYDYLPPTPEDNYFFNIFDQIQGNPVQWYTSGNLFDSKKRMLKSTENLQEKENEAMKRVLHPLISPYYAPLKDLPPILIQCGGVERIRDETIEYVRRLHQVNSTIQSHYHHEVYADQPHVFQAFVWTDSSKAALEKAGQWCDDLWTNRDVLHGRSTSYQELSYHPFT